MLVPTAAADSQRCKACARLAGCARDPDGCGCRCTWGVSGSWRICGSTPWLSLIPFPSCCTLLLAASAAAVSLRCWYSTHSSKVGVDCCLLTLTCSRSSPKLLRKALREDTECGPLGCRKIRSMSALDCVVHRVRREVVLYPLTVKVL